MRTYRFTSALFSLPMAALVAVSCSSNRPVEKADAKAEVQGFLANGSPAGTVWFTEAGNQGTRIQGEIQGLLPNREYAMHVHEIGNCSDPEAPGPHFDPVGSDRHGMPGTSPANQHAGDLPNIKTDEDGKARIDISSHLMGVGQSEFSVMGRSIVIHSDKDDYTTQPAGDSGARIACGVIQPAEG